MIRATVAATSLALLLAGPAHADRNLEEDNPREGFLFGFALGPGAVVGNAGADNQGGAGGSASLRIGTSAGPRLSWMVQLDSVQFVGERGDPVTNVHSTLAVAGQLYLRDALWLKAGIGTANLTETRTDPDDESMTEGSVRQGISVMGSGGYDLYRRGAWAIDLEAAGGLGLYDDGAVFQFAVRLAANRY